MAEQTLALRFSPAALNRLQAKMTLVTLTWLLKLETPARALSAIAGGREFRARFWSSWQMTTFAEHSATIPSPKCPSDNRGCVKLMRLWQMEAGPTFLSRIPASRLFERMHLGTSPDFA